MSKKLALFLGLNKYQENFIKGAKKRNLLTVGVDLNPEAQCVPHVDTYLQHSIDDYWGIMDLLTQRHLIPDAIFAEGSDAGMMSKGYLNSIYGLKGMDAVSATLTRDKLLQRIVIDRSLATKQPKWALDRTFFTASEFDQLVKKPRVGQSSIGVTRYSVNARESTVFESTPEYIWEEYVEGEDYSIDGAVIAGEVLITVLCKKIKHKSNEFVDKILFCDSGSEKCQAFSTELVQPLVNLFKVDNSLFHIEFKCCLDGANQIIELTWRGGGSGLSSTIASAVCKIDVAELLIDALLSNNQNEHHPAIGSAVMYFFSSKHELDATRELLALRNITLNLIYVNRELKSITDGRDRYALGWFLLDQNDNTDELLQQILEQGDDLRV